MLIMSCYTGFFNVRRGWQSLNTGPVRPEDIHKTAFVTKYGLFEFQTMPFGVCNGPPTCQRLMELALNGLQWQICLIYLDDKGNNKITDLRTILKTICKD
jgi:hypothetical protein